MNGRAHVGTMPRRRDNLWQRQTTNENALYDREANSVHILNETAWAIWHLCDGRTSPDEMIEAICDLSGMPRELVNEDVDRVLNQFDEEGLLTWVSS